MNIENKLLICIEGQNGVGKETTVNLLKQHYEKEGKRVLVLSYPQYGKKSCSLVSAYLNKELANNVRDIPPFLASLFYAADRGIDYFTSWKNELPKVDVVIFDRYTSANILYQTGLIKDNAEKIKFAEEVFDLEHNKVGLPKPTVTVLLTLTDNQRKTSAGDLHESDADFENEVRQSQLLIANHFNWKVLDCNKEDGTRLTPNEVLESVLDLIGKTTNS